MIASDNHHNNRYDSLTQLAANLATILFIAGCHKIVRNDSLIFSNKSSWWQYDLS